MKKLMVILVCMLIKEGFTENWTIKPTVNLQYPCTLFISDEIYLSDALIKENFNAGTIPLGWTVVNGGGNDTIWVLGPGSLIPHQVMALTMPGFCIRQAALHQLVMMMILYHRPR